jgi:osmotically-inducible protein OsmY
MVTTLTDTRPDVDIAEDIRDFIRGYDPLKQARDYFEFSVHEGVVVIKGNVRTIQAQRVLEDGLPDIAGVGRLDSSDLHNDEDLRLHLGKLPHGVMARVNFGYVVLTGSLPAGTEAEGLIAKVEKLPGVRKVVTQFY